MPKSKNIAPAQKPTTKRPTDTKKKVSARSSRTTKPIIPILSEVGPELKDHIISQPQPNQDYSYWQALGWFGAGMIGILITTGSAIWLASLKQPHYPTSNITPAVNQPLLTEISPLTGLPTSPETMTRRPWAVVVENFFTVRPQAGLGAADIVFESPTEGGITRLLAIYQSSLPKLVGPVRSARSYFNDWIRPFSPFYSHSGGSDRALQQLRAGYGGIIDINEFFHGAAYERISKFTPPHNLFTTTERFSSYLTANKYELESAVPKLSFVDTLPPAPTITSITLPYLPEEYEVTYEYKPASGTYQRLVDGTTQLDATTNQVLTVKNVVVLFTDIEPIPNDPLLRVELRTLGTGEARVYTGGQVYSGTWRKTKPDSLIELVDNSGQILPLQPGNTWFSAMDSSEVINFPINLNIPLSL